MAFSAEQQRAMAGVARALGRPAIDEIDNDNLEGPGALPLPLAFEKRIH